MKKFSYLFVIIALLSSCRKEKDPQPAAASDILEKQGYLKGTIVSATSDDETINSSFTYEGVFGRSTISPLRGGNSTVVISRYQAVSTLSYLTEEQMSLSFTLNSSKTALVSLREVSITKNVAFKQDTIVRFEASYDSATPNTTNLSLSNVVYNASTGNFTADYILFLDAENTESGKTATITGSINVNLISIQYREEQ